MLVLGRKMGQSIDLFDERTGNHIARITVVDERTSDIRIGVDAVSNVKILRTELLKPRLSGSTAYEVGTA